MYLWNVYSNDLPENLEAIIATPVNVEDVIVGELLWGMFRSVFYGSIILMVILFFGMIRSPGALLVPFLLFIPGFLFALLAMIFTAFSPSIDFFNYYITLFITPMFFFSGIFFPLDRMPEWVRVAAWWTPLYHVVALCRPLIVGGLHKGLWIHFIWLVVATVLLFPLPVFLMKRRLIK